MKLQIPGEAFKEYSEGEQLISQGWHTFEITKVEGPILAANGGSMNNFLHVKCLTPESEKRNMPRTCFNEKSFEPSKAKYQVIPFILALDPALTAKELASSGISIEFNDLPGKRFDGKITHEEYQGRFKEKFSDYAPAGTRAGKE